MPMGVVLSAPPFEDASRAYTRAWEPPTGYYLYENLYGGSAFKNDYTLTNKSINAFFTQGSEDEPLHGSLIRQSDGTWVFSSKNDPITIGQGNYYAYGFIPREAADGASITRLPDDPTTHSYADGAVLTIHGLKAVAADACVMIGAKDGFPDKTDPENIIYYDGKLTTDKNGNGKYDEGDEITNRLRRGDFNFELKAVDSSSGLEDTPDNYLFFLFDHLCSALVINMRVHPEYDALRTIRLKEVRLQTATNSAIIKKLMNVTITLNATDGSDPIKSIVYTPINDSGDSDGQVFKSSTELGLTLTTDLTDVSLLSHFVSKGVTRLLVTSRYDVYDKNVTIEHPEGNLLRKDCTATNNIPLNLISYFTEAERCKKYTLNMTIQPTYLYVLSDPDLNNPTVTID